MINLVRAVAIDYAAQGVRINAIASGLTRTGVTAGVQQDPALLAAIERRIPLGRFAEPREQAEAIWFLASPAAGYITGTTLAVDAAPTPTSAYCRYLGSHSERGRSLTPISATLFHRLGRCAVIVTGRATMHENLCGRVAVR